MENGIAQTSPTPVRAPARSREQWQALHDTWQSSALTQREFCDTQGIRNKTFRRWCRRFRKDAASVQTEAAPPGWNIERALGPDVVLRIRRS